MREFLKKTCLIVLAGLTLAFSAPAAFADECYPTTGTFDLIIAVASNLWGPMKDDGGLVPTFLDSTFNSGEYTVQVCHNATGILVGEITTGGNAQHYGLFLAANVDGPASVCAYNASLCVPYGTPSVNTFTYTKGIPVLWTKTAGLIDTSTGTINLASVDHVDIADPDNAPYGLAAKQIMQNVTNQWSLLGTRLQEFSNIDATFVAVDSATDGKTVGYVAKSQICNDNAPIGYFYEYSTSAYSPIIQNGAIINVTTPAKSNAAATAFVNFLLSNADDAGQDILVNHFCYQALNPSAVKKVGTAGAVKKTGNASAVKKVGTTR
jgi:molybdate transport system substrate-binding protein